MNRTLPMTTNELPLLGAVAFACVGGMHNGLPFAQRLLPASICNQWIGGYEAQVHPGEGAT